MNEKIATVWPPDFGVNNFSGHSLLRVKITRNITIFMILRRLSNYTFSTDKSLDLTFFFTDLTLYLVHQLTLK